MISNSSGLAIVVVALSVSLAVRAEATDLLTSENGDVADGNKLLAEGKPAEALESYDNAARALPGRHGVHVNRGLALSRMGEEQLDQAMQAFSLASEGGGSDPVRARAMANLGNAFFKKEDFTKAIELYKKSLMLVPGNKDVAWNLELARQKKKEKEEQQQDQQDQQDKQDQQDQQDQQDKKDQQDQEEKQDKQDQQQQDKQDQQQQEQQQDQQQEQPQPQPKTKQEIEQVLDSLENQEEDLMKKMARQKRAAVPVGRHKDW